MAKCKILYITTGRYIEFSKGNCWHTEILNLPIEGEQYLGYRTVKDWFIDDVNRFSEEFINRNQLQYPINKNEIEIIYD